LNAEGNPIHCLDSSELLVEIPGLYDTVVIHVLLGAENLVLRARSESEDSAATCFYIGYWNFYDTIKIG